MEKNYGNLWKLVTVVKGNDVFTLSFMKGEDKAFACKMAYFTTRNFTCYVYTPELEYTYKYVPSYKPTI